MNFINKLKQKNNLPIILFVVIILRYLVTIIPNLFSKDVPITDSSIINKVYLLIQIILLIYVYFNNIKEIKINKKYTVLLLVVSVIMGIVQIKNIIQSNYYLSDVFNIGCFIVNVFMFYIVLYDFKINEKNISLFFKGIIFFAIIALVWNLILFNKEILAEFGILFENVDYSHLNNPKGFFGNRNTLAFFMYLAIISDAILINIEGEKKLYKSLFLVFLFGVWCTHSKTGYIVFVMFLGLYVLFNDKYKIKKKVIICSCIMILTILGGLNILGRIPTKNILVTNSGKIEESSLDEVSKHLVMTTGRIKRLSGRMAIWKAGFGILNKSPFNYICGVGKVNAVQVLKDIDGKEYSEFHNIYLDILLSGGILELAYIIFIYYTVVKKIMKSDLNIMLKRIYYIVYITYFIYIMFESLGRFSTSEIDATCLIFFISIPLLHANSIKQIDNNLEEKKDEIVSKMADENSNMKG